MTPSDDGFSGGNFDRPDWKRLIEEIDKGNVGTVIAKDMSRIGRDYLQTGFFTEVLFREKGIRFIAIANNIDSQNKESGEFAPFLNIMSEWYLRDASRKVKASHKARGMSGKRLTFKAIYGYMPDPQDKEKWIIDPEASEVVKRIFDLINENGYHCTRAPKDVYVCSTYNLTGRRYDRKCTTHNIRTVVLRELALDAIKSVSTFVKANEVEFVKQVRETSTIQQEEAAKSHKRRIAKEQKRIAELDTLIRRIYENNVSGKLTDKRFQVLSQEYEQEQTELEQSIERLQSELDSFHADSARADKFIEIVKKHTDFSELTPQMIAEYIEKIVVHEADKSSGERQQAVDIYLNFIGKFQVPTAPPTAEEIAAEEKAFRKREQRREAQRRYAAKQKQKAQEQEQAAHNKGALKQNTNRIGRLTVTG